MLREDADVHTACTPPAVSSRRGPRCADALLAVIDGAIRNYG
jgi:hypothetical protein